LWNSAERTLERPVKVISMNCARACAGTGKEGDDGDRQGGQGRSGTVEVLMPGTRRFSVALLMTHGGFAVRIASRPRVPQRDGEMPE